MDEPTRRAWSRPEVIVLVRSGPEEAVLITCKGPSAAVQVSNSVEGCDTPGPGGACDACASTVGS